MGFDTVGNGCGACSGFWKWFKPPHSKFFEEECNTHDRAYDLGGDYVDRYISDVILFRDMRKSVYNHFYRRKLFSKIWFLFLCVMYYIGVRLVGFTNFNYETGNKTFFN